MNNYEMRLEQELEKRSQEVERLRAELAMEHDVSDDRLGRAVQAEARLREVVDAAQMLGGAVGDVLQGWDAHRQLAAGYRGMGQNILIESAGKYKSLSCWIRVRRHYDALCAALAAAQPEERRKEDDPCASRNDGTGSLYAR